MGGKKTGFRLTTYTVQPIEYRTGITAQDASPDDVTAVIDLTNSVTALNTVNVYAAGGAADTEIQIWFLIGDTWFLGNTATMAVANEGFTFDALPCTYIKLTVSTYVSGSITLYVEHTE